MKRNLVQIHDEPYTFMVHNIDRAYYGIISPGAITREIWEPTEAEIRQRKIIAKVKLRILIFRRTMQIMLDIISIIIITLVFGMFPTIIYETPILNILYGVCAAQVIIILVMLIHGFIDVRPLWKHKGKFY